MRTQIKRWGNSLAVQIPDVLAGQLGISENTPVELDVVDGALVIRTSSKLTLAHLLAGIACENLCGEIESGPFSGEEAW